MEASPNEVEPTSTLREQALQDLDRALGPLKVGEQAVSRVALDKMGARWKDAPFAFDRWHVNEMSQNVIDQMTLSAPDLKAYLASASADTADQVSGVLFELASLRSEGAGVLLNHAQTPDTTISRLDRLLQAVQNVNLNDQSSVDSLPGWADKVRSASAQTLGTGLALYGFYSAIRGIGDAIRKGDTGELLFESGAFGAEVLSLGVELALVRVGTKMMSAAQAVYRGFCASRIGMLLHRGGGLFASVLTLPFDIAQAVIALSKAVKVDGKTAQDLYVEAGFSLAGATLSAALGVAALAGFGAAGPVGLVASAILVVGARIYAAARAVDEIDDYIELSTHERLRSGWFSFWGVDLDKELLDRYSITRTSLNHAERLKSRAQSLLNGELKDSVQAIVNGKFAVRLQTVQLWKHQWDETTGEAPFKEVSEAVIQDVNDYFDARKEGAIDQLPEASWGVKGPEKGVVWLLGGGEDTVLGVPSSPNHFRYAGGKKYLVGSSEDDEFIFEVPQGYFSQTAQRIGESILIGNTGTDALTLTGDADWPRGVGFKVNLGARTVELITGNTLNGLKNMSISGIENISTLERASSTVTGSNEANRIVLKGDQDTAYAEDGDDQLLIQAGSARVNGGPGADYYEISENAKDVTIEEDGRQPSVILLNWAFNRIQRWWIAGNDLKVDSALGRDGELPGPVVTVSDVYRAQEGKRCLINSLFGFLTQDGYRLTPVLPEELDLAGEPPVSVQVIAPPGPGLSPVILGAGQSVNISAGAYNYFVNRSPGMTTINAAAGEESSRCTLYIDYDGEELSAVYTTYHVSARRQANFVYLDYKDATIKFVFVDGRELYLNDYAAQRAGSWTNVGGAVQASAFKLKAEFIVVMRDGVSYRVLPPMQSYFSDNAEPGYKALDGTVSLALRTGKYQFFKPRRTKSINLTARAQRLKLGQAPHQANYMLAGQGGQYEVHLTPWAIVELSTPGALRKESNASTWDVYCDGLEEEVGLENIALHRRSIEVGSVSIRVPRPDDPAVPLENIRIHSKAGARYDVRLDIDSVFLAQVSASQNSSVPDLLKLLRQCRQRSSVFTPAIKVTGVHMADGAKGTLYFEVMTDCWRLDTDWSREISSDQLLVSSDSSASSNLSVAAQ